MTGAFDLRRVFCQGIEWLSSGHLWGRMAAKTVKVTTEEVRDDESVAVKEELDDDLVRALTELDDGPDISWQVKRVSEPNPGFCEPRLSTAELSVQRIAELFGPGRYHVRGIRSNGQFFKHSTLTIASPPKKDASPIVKDTGTDPSTLFQFMQLQMQQSQAAAAQQTAVLTALIGKPQSEFPWPALLSATPAVLVAAKEFFSKKDNEDASMEKILKLVTIVEKLKGNDKETGTSWPDIIRDALPTIASTFQRSPTNGMHPRSASATQATPVQAQIAKPTATSLETPEAVEPTVEIMSMNWLRDKINELIANAAANKNPELRAEVFCDDLPAYIPETLVIELLSSDDWFEKLAGFDSRVTLYPAWFAELRDNILITLQPDGDEHDRHTARAAPDP